MGAPRRIHPIHIKHGTYSAYANERCRCDLCRKACREHSRRLRERDPQKHRLAAHADHLRRTFGLTPADVARMVAQQDGCCAICRDTLRPHDGSGHRETGVDHNHATKRVRGVLCRRCNLGLGKFRDKPALLRSGARYVETDGRMLLDGIGAAVLL